MGVFQKYSSKARQCKHCVFVPRFVCHSLTTGVNYVFRVKAVNAAGYSPSSPDSEALLVKAAICKRLCISVAMICFTPNHSVSPLGSRTSLHPRMESRASVFSLSSFPSSQQDLSNSKFTVAHPPSRLSLPPPRAPFHSSS